MANLFLISDTHFSHAACLKFTLSDGVTPLRAFKSVEEMDETMVERWNKVVKPQDHVYHLGDVAMKREQLKIVRKLNGHKRLIFGNHDIFEAKEYLNVGFEKVMGMRVLDGYIMTHIPIHPCSLGRFSRNIHGHLHATQSPGEPYISVCVEQINYTPISFEELKKKYGPYRDNPRNDS